MNLNVTIQSLDPAALKPVYATDGSGCFDLHACTIAGSKDPITLAQGQSVLIGTGLAFEIPAGYVMLVFGRSGHGINYHASLTNRTGLIDSDYRGEVMIKLGIERLEGAKHSELVIKPGDRIAQGIVLPYPRVNFQWGDQLQQTARGAGGFGSTGQ